MNANDKLVRFLLSFHTANLLSWQISRANFIPSEYSDDLGLFRAVGSFLSC